MKGSILIKTSAASVLILCMILLSAGCGGTSGPAADIGQEEALNAALNHAGLEISEVELTKSAKSIDDGKIQYDFDFRNDTAKYEYEIDGITAEVLEYSMQVVEKAKAPETESRSAQPESSGSANEKPAASGSTTGSTAAAAPDYIGVEKAKSIALENSGVKASEATFTTAELDRDDGRYVYEIDFHTADREYDYEIDAVSGKILDRDNEPLDSWDDDWDD